MITRAIRIVNQETFLETKIPVLAVATSCSMWDSVFNTKCTECNTIVTAGCDHMKEESGLIRFKKQSNSLYQRK